MCGPIGGKPKQQKPQKQILPAVAVAENARNRPGATVKKTETEDDALTGGVDITQPGGVPAKDDTSGTQTRVAGEVPLAGLRKKRKSKAVGIDL